MKYSMSCPLCRNEFINRRFTISVNPTTNAVYNITCPIGHKFNIYIPTNHFQTLFENGLNSLADQYYIEALSSFASSYERFMEFFVKIVLKSRGVNPEICDTTWKSVAKLSERQLGAFIFVYLKEFSTPPKLLNENNITLRNNVVHKGYFPSMEECIRYGDNVLEALRPIIELLNSNEVYNSALSKSIYSSESINHTEIRMTYICYPLFAINRGINSADEKLVADYLIDRYEDKNDEKNEETLKKIRLLVKEKPNPPKPIKSIVNNIITKDLLIELYNFRYFNSGESDITLLIDSHSWKKEDIEQIISHLELIGWINRFGDGKYTLRGIGSVECEERKFIKKEVAAKHIAERESLLNYLYKNKTQKINYKYSQIDLARDMGKDINEMGVYMADIKELGYVTHYYKLTEKGEKIISK